MERITGIGGVFLRAKDPAALVAWYRDTLGIEPEDGGPYATLRSTGGEVTVWSMFPDDTDYFGRRDQQAMINYRVADLDAMLAQLRAAGANVDDPAADEGFGRFAWAEDPEGNRFELWQPPEGQ